MLHLQSNPVYNTDTEGSIESVSINWVPILSGSCYESQKHLLLEQITKEIKEDIGVVTLNISNLLKAVIPRKKFKDNSFNAKIV